MLTQLVEAVTGVGIDTALQERITGPLGLEATVFPAGDADPPTPVAGGWAAPFGGMELAYVSDEWDSNDTIDAQVFVSNTHPVWDESLAL